MATREGIDAALAAWRQGDCVLGDHWFLARADPASPLTDTSREACDPDTGAYEEEVPGFMVLTQTCDLVRSADERPYVEVAALEAVTEATRREVLRGRRPRYAAVPALRDLVADLDRVMTVEKAVVAGWARVPGCATDEDARLLRLALARKVARPAFPDDFVLLVGRLQSRLTEKHDKQSDEGRALRGLREIRVRAAPAWDADEVELTLFFIPDTADFAGAPWHTLLATWLALVPPSGRFCEVDGLVQTLSELTAEDDVESDPLDLGYLSTRPA